MSTGTTTPAAAAPQAATPPGPKRGEVWRVQLDPVRGAEQRKTRPVVVLTEPPTGRATVRLCVPVVHEIPPHRFMVWCAALAPTSANGLTKASTVDTAQARALDVVRFEAKLGDVDAAELETITTALILCIGRQPAP